MRIAAFLCAVAVCTVCGCASGQRASYLAARQQWQALCDRMPQAGISDHTAAVEPTRVDSGRQGALKRTAERVQSSVVWVKTTPQPSPTTTLAGLHTYGVSNRSGGSGVVISAGGLILTNEHVVRHADRITVVFRDGRECPVQAVVAHARLDLAVLRIDSDGLTPLVPSRAMVRPRDAVVAVSAEGHDGAHQFRSGVLTNPRVSLQRELDPSGRRDYNDLLESTVSLEPGFSGGPLLTARGAFVGINVAVTGQGRRRETRGYAIAFDDRNREAIGQLSLAASR